MLGSIIHTIALPIELDDVAIGCMAVKALVKHITLVKQLTQENTYEQETTSDTMSDYSTSANAIGT
jgi:hypothetical protein